MGKGKSMVLFFSVEISVMVWSNLSCRVPGSAVIALPAAASFSDASNSPVARITRALLSRSASACHDKMEILSLKPYLQEIFRSYK